VVCVARSGQFDPTSGEKGVLFIVKGKKPVENYEKVITWMTYDYYLEQFHNQNQPKDSREKRPRVWL